MWEGQPVEAAVRFTDCVPSVRVSLIAETAKVTSSCPAGTVTVAGKEASWPGRFDESVKVVLVAWAGARVSRAVPAAELQTWLEQTVLPRKAPWIGSALEEPVLEALPRALGGRQSR